MYFDYSITIDNLPSSTHDDCQIITTETGCFVHVDWYNDQMSEVFYGANPNFLCISIIGRTER